MRIRLIAALLASSNTNKSIDTNSMIRRVSKDDIPGLKKIVDDTNMFPSEMLDDMVQFGKDEEVWFTKVDETTSILVAVAYCKAEPLTDGTWNTLLLAASPQGQGHGSDMMRHIEANLGARMLLVDTSGTDEYVRSRRFYENTMGYEMESRIRDYYAEGDDKITYRKKIT